MNLNFLKRNGNKKGSVLDLIFIMGIMLSMGVLILIVFMVVSNMNDVFQTKDILPDTSKTASQQITDIYPGTIDNMFMFSMLVLALGSIILAVLVRFHPIFIVLFFISLIFIIFISGVMSNIYQDMAASEGLIAYANQLDMITTGLTYLPLIITVIGTILMVVMYKQWKINQD